MEKQTEQGGRISESQSIENTAETIRDADRSVEVSQDFGMQLGGGWQLPRQRIFTSGRTRIAKNRRKRSLQTFDKRAQAIVRTRQLIKSRVDRGVSLRRRLNGVTGNRSGLIEHGERPVREDGFCLQLLRTNEKISALKRIGKNWFSVRWTGERYDIRCLRRG
ncbi:hypothetical protein [Xanthomonas arboricola]|uniref:hypothetical protein n=1 Tax=Xanthomonas arboricola TaxID=56448 RepID=UPI00142F5328|nr:hypothetical protein [Xanthomonas arboricola]NJB80327.1 hypothetical protein [Xanthomonas arboricola]